MNRLAFVCGGAALIGVVGSVSAQPCTPGWAPGFPNEPSFDGEARGVAFFDAGAGAGPQLYVGGYFLKDGETVLNGIARWTGTEWAPVGGGVAPTSASSATGIYWIGVLDDGAGPALYAAGNFQSAGGVPARGVARWDGSAWSALGEGLNNTVRMMCAYDDGTGPAIYAVGIFDYSGTAPVKGVARWDGNSWTPVGPGLTAGPAGYGRGYSIGVFDLGQGPRLVVGGNFTEAGGVAANNVATWDGREWAALGEGVTGPDVLIIGLAMFDHGNGPRLHIGGRFSLAPASAQTARVALWTGSQWLQVGSDLSADPSHYVNSFAVMPGASGPILHAGGLFSGASWLGQADYAAQFVGGEWRSMESGMSNYIRAMTVHDEAGSAVLYAAGGFGTAGNVAADRVARWDGTEWSGLETHNGLNGPAGSAMVFDDGAGERLYVGGLFTIAGGLVVNGIATWDGAAWHGVGGGVTANGLGRVLGFGVFDDGGGPALYAGGAFDFAGGTPCSNIARWDGVHWSPLAGGGVDGSVTALVAHQDPVAPALFIGGSFSHAGTARAQCVARWDGAAWSAVGTGVQTGDYGVSALALFDDGTGLALYAGGSFTVIGGIVADGIARWNGREWLSLGGLSMAPASGIPSVRDFQVWDDGTGPALFVGGQFWRVGQLEALNIARWRGGWSTVGHGQTGQPAGTNSRVSSLCIDAHQKLWVGGQFTAAGPNGSPGTVRNVTRWDGSQWSPPPSGVGVSSQSVSEIAAWGASLFFAGNFALAGGHETANFAEWRGCVCYADCTEDGLLTVTDFGCFQTKFVAGNPDADCNGDGRLGVQDFECFQTEFVAGCP